MRDTAPLWGLCTLNDEALSEKTDPLLAFDYVDISNVSEGSISDDLERVTFASAPSRARRIARDGDVIVSTVRTYLRAIAQVEKAERQRIYSTGFAVLRPDTIVTDPRYVAYVLGSDQVMDEIVATSVGVSYPAIQGSALHRIRVPHHDLATQKRIADYLDRETGEIDAMIAKMNELASNLRARLRAETHRVLAPALKSATKPIWSVLLPVKDQNHPGEEVLSVYRDYGVIPKASRDDNANRTPQDLTAYQLVEPGDVVINKMKAWQGSLGVSEFRGIVSPDYQVARPACDMDSRFLHAVLRSQFMVPQYRARSIGVRPSQWRLYWNEFADLLIPLPPPAEQAHIADHLDEVTGKIDAMLAKVAELKSLLTERRAALITDVVSGRKEVA
jgi:type I restriction enzyme S subunit